MHFTETVHAMGTLSCILILTWINHIIAADTSGNMIIETHWDRFSIKDVCSTENRNLRLYLDYGDNGWVRGYPMDDSFTSDVTTTPVCCCCSFVLWTALNEYFSNWRHRIGTDSSTSKATTQHGHLVSDVIMHFGIGDMSIVPVQGHCKVRCDRYGWCSYTLYSLFIHRSELNIVNNGKCAKNKQDDSTISPSTEPEAAHDNNNLPESCLCNYLAFSEPQFEADIVRKRMCNGMKPPMQYIGYTRSVLMHFKFGVAASMDSFNVTFNSESK